MMDLLCGALGRLPEFEQLLAAMDAGGCPVALSGVAAVHRAHFAAAIGARREGCVVVVCADEAECDRMARDLGALTGKAVPVLTSRAFTFHSAATVSHQWEQRRLAVLHRLQQGQLPFLVCSVESLLQRTMPPAVLEQCAFSLTVGQSADLSRVARQLTDAGSTRCEQVEGPGQFALRGGILDVFAPGMAEPVRCDFFDDEVDSLGAFDLTTQRRTRNVEAALVLPAAERLEGQPLISAFDALPADALVCLMEGGRVGEREKNSLKTTQHFTKQSLKLNQLLLKVNTLNQLI